jgi:hypothetical protein
MMAALFLFPGYAYNSSSHHISGRLGSNKLYALKLTAYPIYFFYEPIPGLLAAKIKSKK